MNLFNNSFDKITSELQTQRFVVLIHIMEGTDFLKPNMNTCVQVQVHTETKTTRVRKATHAPYYNETFVFDFEQTFENFLDNVVTLTVLDTGGKFKSKKPLGLTQFDLSTVWDMEDRQIYHKWAKLTDPKNRMPFIKGYLKFDLYILGAGETLTLPKQMSRTEEKPEDNLLFGAPGRNLEAQARYIIRVYKGADFLSKDSIPFLNQGSNSRTDTTSNVSVAVTYAKHTLSTDRKSYQSSWHSYIVWDDQFTFTEIFPPTFQRVKFEVLINKSVVYTFYMNLRDVEGFAGLMREIIPVFGPSVVYVYTEDMFYSGVLLISVEAIPVSVALLKLSVGTAEKTKAISLQQEKLWSDEEFLLFMAVYEMGMLRKELSGNDMSLVLSIGRHSQQLDHMSSSTQDNVYYSLNITKDKPCLHVKVKLPDLRRRLYLSNRIHRIEDELNEKLDQVEKKMFSKDMDKAESTLREAAKEFGDKLATFDTSCKHLEADEKLTMKHLRRKLEEMRRELQHQPYNLKTIEERVEKLRGFSRILAKFTQESHFSFPYVFIYILNKNKLVAARKIHPRHFVYSEVEKERGLSCGKFNSLFFTKMTKNKRFSRGKDKIPTDTLGGRIDAYMWFGLYSLRDESIQMLPIEEDMKVDMLAEEEIPTVIAHRNKTVFQTRAHLYNAIIDLGHDVSGMSDPYVRVISGPKSAISHTVKATVTPSWKETVVIPQVERYRTISRIKQNQPIVILELWDDDSYKSKTEEKGDLKALSTKLIGDEADELIGRAMVRPNVVLKDDSSSVTKLRTYAVYDREVKVGEITAAVELVEVTEGDETILDGDEQDPKLNKEAFIYKIPEALLPPTKAYIMEVLFWGLRDVQKIRTPSIAIRCGEGKLNSTVIRDYKKFQNFDTISGVVEVNLYKYKTPLVMKLYQRKRGGHVYKGIYVHDNIHDLFKSLIEEKVWKEHLDQRNTLLRERALSEAKSRSEVRINMDLQIGELERIRHASRKHKRKHFKCREKCKKCLNKTGKNAVRTGHNFKSWLKLPERKKHFNICSIPYLFITLVQFVVWILQKGILFTMYCVCGYSRAVTIRTRYQKLIELSPSDSDSNVYDTFNIPEEEEDVENEEEKQDWWSLYYNSVYSSGVTEKIQQIRRESEERKKIRLCKCCNVGPRRRKTVEITQEEVATEKPTLIVYRQELEKVPEFEQFSDILRTFDIYYGKLFTKNKNTLADLRVASFKGNIMFYPADNAHLVTSCGKPLTNGTLEGSMDNDTLNVTIRVYVVRAYGLHPKDKDGNCDPYIILRTGSTEIDDRQNFVQNQINPYFGRYFEIQGAFPVDYKLILEIKDHDTVSKDDFIGKTEIDLESRFYSHHRGCCGLARRYTSEWRDQLRPTQLLEELCDRHEIGYPVYFDKSVVVGSREFAIPSRTDSDDIREDLALYALHNWHQVPLVGAHLVPQHIESRTLYSPLSQGVSQGVLEMWVDVFNTDYGWVPPPVKIELRKPEEYELRVIVWNTADVELMDDAYFTGEKHSDIYVKGWLQGKDDVQQTDVHYGSAQGEGFFNWRFLFVLKYFYAEALMLVTRKDEEYRVPPKLHLQVWDNDNFSPDDYIGTLVLDLSRMPRGARSAARCTADIVKDTAPTLNLFQTKRCKGWWPFLLGGNGPDKHKVVGKLEAELHIVTKEEAETSPVGLGRKDPEALPVPVRPDRFNFNFIWTPYRVLLALVKAHKTTFILAGIIFAVILLGVLFVYAFPGYTVKWLLHV